MHGFYVGVMFFVDVVVYFFFCVEDFSTFRAHVLSSSGFRCASAFDYLTQIQLAPPTE
jgi:hypothetical protein